MGVTVEKCHMIMSVVAKRLDGLRCHMTRVWYGGRLRPRRRCVRWVLRSHYPKRGSTLRPNIDPRLMWPNSWMDQDETWHEGAIVLDGDPTPSPKGAQPAIFGRCLMWPNGWMDAVGMEVDLCPGHVVLDGDPDPPREGHSSPLFSADICCGQTVAHLSYC